MTERDNSQETRYRCTECGTVHDELPDHCHLCYATNDKFFEAI